MDTCGSNRPSAFPSIALSSNMPGAAMIRAPRVPSRALKYGASSTFART